MKAYRKTLRPALINGLNDLYDKKGLWWQTVVDDDQVFILVRDNHLRVLVHGGLLLMITDRAGKITCEPHKEYLNLRSETDPYVTISENHTAPLKCAEFMDEFVHHYDRLKRRIEDLVGKERQYCHTMSLNIKEIVDKEVGLVLEKSEDTNRNSAQHADFQSVSDDGKMVFTEVKLFRSPDICSPELPVVNQLQKYEGIIKSHEREIRDAYTEQRETYSQLKGDFFKKKKLPVLSNIPIHPTVRLIITDFDEGELKVSLPRIQESIEKGMGWGKNSNNLITVGNPINVNAGHIFKGI